MSVTIVHVDGALVVPDGRHENGSLWIGADDIATVTGWTPKPIGLCRGDLCLTPSRDRDWMDESGRVDLLAVAERLRLPVVHDKEHAVWSLGASAAQEAQTSDEQDPAAPVEAPDFELPDLDGKVHHLSDYRGNKVLLLAWASY